MNNKVVIKSNLKDIMGFAKMISIRKGKFEAAPNTPLPKTYKVNETASFLHPKEQKVKIKSVSQLMDGVKSYVFESATDKPLAYFRAGQYICIELKIGESLVSRPYSLSSSPKEALEGIYRITVKRTDGGLVSGYVLDNWIEGDEVTISAPEGTFVYEPLRDAKTIVGLAGGSGITPFVSLAKAIDDGTEDAKLILLYGAAKEKDILFKDELDELSKNDKITVVYVLSNQKKKGYENGFITSELISKYAPGKYSVFICGPAAMYSFLKQELPKLSLESKFIRFELFGEQKNPASLPGFPESAVGKTYNLTVTLRDSKNTIPAMSEESILTSLERAGIKAPASCRSGECGFCRSKLVSGDVFIPQDTDARRIADVKFGYIHPCCTYPVGDIEIIV